MARFSSLLWTRGFEIWFILNHLVHGISGADNRFHTHRTKLYRATANESVDDEGPTSAIHELLLKRADSVPDDFFQLNDAAWKAANPLEYLRNWSTNSRSSYLSENAQALGNFFASSALSWPNMECSLANRGCVNKPPLAYIRGKYPDPETARKAFFSILSFDSYYRYPAAVIDALNKAGDDMASLCPKLASTFFHKKEHSHNAECAFGYAVAVAVAIVIFGAVTWEFFPEFFALTPSFEFSSMTTSPIAASTSLMSEELATGATRLSSEELGAAEMASSLASGASTHTYCTTCSDIYFYDTSVDLTEWYYNSLDAAASPGGAASPGSVSAPSEYLQGSPGVLSEWSPHSSTVSAPEPYSPSWSTSSRETSSDYFVHYMDGIRVKPKFFARSIEGDKKVTMVVLPEMDQDERPSGHVRLQLVNQLRSVEKRDEGNASPLITRKNWELLVRKLSTMGLASEIVSPSAQGLRKRAAGSEMSVVVNSPVFHNLIKHSWCNFDYYSGNKKANTEACRGLTDYVIGNITAGITDHINAADNANADNWVDGQPAPLVTKMADMFPKYPDPRKIFALQYNPNFLKEEILKQLKPQFVAKAWRDQQCYIQCGEFDQSCRASCWDGLSQDNKSLYGLKKAQKEPWNITKEDVVHSSLRMYKLMLPRIPNSFSINLGGTNDGSVPILPVCQSELMRVKDRKDKHDHDFPCTCGNIYGDKSVGVWKSAAFGDAFDNDRAVNTCRKHLTWLARDHPAAYMINMCQLYFNTIFPGGSGEATKNKHHYNKNKEFCDAAKQNFEDALKENKSDAEMDQQLCKVWMAHKLHADKPGDHADSHNHFDAVNHDLKHGGCKVELFLSDGRT